MTIGNICNFLSLIPFDPLPALPLTTATTLFEEQGN